MGIKRKCYEIACTFNDCVDQWCPSCCFKLYNFLKKVVAKFLNSNYRVDIEYNIEHLNRQVDEVFFKGWVADKHQVQTKFKIILASKHIKKDKGINLVERQDIINEHPGFSLQCGFDEHFFLRNGEPVRMYISNIGPYFWDEKHILIETFEANCGCNGFYTDAFNTISAFVFKDFKEKFLKTAHEVTVVRPVDIIVPVYNGIEFFDRLFSTLTRTKLPNRIIIIDDCSPDPKVYPQLEKISMQNPNMFLLKNEKNLGFVGTVNRGLKLTTNDVIIVNTDVELPNAWAERLMQPIFNNSTIASSTPFTNSGIICSFPQWLVDNPIFNGYTVDQVDSEFAKITPIYTEIPTGVGFCMGMSRKALDKVGIFSEKFGKGYGEENDWCRRCSENGFMNVHVENLFVYHKHGGSFTPSEKKQYTKSNLVKLQNLHPDYCELLDEYILRNPLDSLRNYLLVKLAALDSEVILYIDHGWGGGATKYVDERIAENSNEAKLSLRLIEKDGVFHLYVYFSGSESDWQFIDLRELDALLDDMSVHKIIVSETVAFSELREILDYLVELKNKKDATMDFLVHDYYCVCPSFYLLNCNDQYCNPNRNTSFCKNCIATNKNSSITTDISYWRESWQNFLNNCTKVIAFSKYSKDLLTKIYPINVPIDVIPHKVTNLRPVDVSARHQGINVCVLGNFMKHKGFKIVSEMADICQSKSYPINLYHLGMNYCGEVKNLKDLGPYSSEDLPNLIEKYSIDLIFIPSIWPETFSYTTEEGMMMNLPVAAFDLGAPAERLSKYCKGIVIKDMCAEGAILEIMKYFENQR